MQEDRGAALTRHEIVSGPRTNGDGVALANNLDDNVIALQIAEEHVRLQVRS